MKNKNKNTINIRKENNKEEVLPDQERKMGRSYSDRFSGKFIKEYVWDKNINRLVEKMIPSIITKVEENRLDPKENMIPQPKPQERKVERVVGRKVETNKPKVVERKYETYNKGVERKVETQPKVRKEFRINQKYRKERLNLNQIYNIKTIWF